jgi:hypothetical protein
VAFALSALGPEAKVAIPELKALANDSDDYSGSEAAKMALKRLDADKGEVQR